MKRRLALVTSTVLLICISSAACADLHADESGWTTVMPGILITKDGNIYQTPPEHFGYFTDELIKIEGIDNPTQVEVGGAGEYAAIAQNGDLFTWGNGHMGALGHGNMDFCELPKRVESLSNVVHVSIGVGLAAAITEDGSVYVWGRLYKGDDSDCNAIIENVTTPERVEELCDVIDVSCGHEGFTALTGDGMVYTWGLSFSGALGHGDRFNLAKPKRIEFPERIIAADMNWYTGAAVTEKGELYTWGVVIGRDSAVPSNIWGDSTPAKVDMDEPVTSVCIGDRGNAAVLAETGEVYMWGAASGSEDPQSPFAGSYPVHVNALSDVIQISLAGGMCTALTDYGTVFQWGGNSTMGYIPYPTVYRTDIKIPPVKRTAPAIRVEVAFEPVLECYDYYGSFHEGFANIGVLDLETGDMKHGFIDTNGKQITPVIYKRVSSYTEGLAAVTLDDDQYGYIDTSGTLVIAAEYEAVFGFENGVSAVCKNSKYGLINKNGDAVTPLEYDELFGFTDGKSVVRKGDKWGMIDSYGNLVIPLEFDGLNRLGDSLMLGVLNGNQVCVDMEGNVVFEYDYDMTDGFHEGYAWVRKNNKCGIIDTSGNLVIPLIYDSISTFSDGFASVRNDGKTGVIDKRGNVVIPIEYEFGHGLVDGFTRMYKEEKMGFVNIRGDLVVPFEYDTARDYSDGLALVGVSDGISMKMGFVNQLGELVVPLVYDDAQSFSEGMAYVGQRTQQGIMKYGMINTSREVVVPFIYDDVGVFQEGLCDVSIDGKHGCIDAYGNVIVPLEYDEPVYFRGEYAWVMKDGRAGLLKMVE